MQYNVMVVVVVVVVVVVMVVRLCDRLEVGNERHNSWDLRF